MSRKAIVNFYKLHRVARANWGLGFKALKVLYKGIGESILLYGAAVWAHRLSVESYAKVLLRAQRTMLLTICKGYRTLSLEATQVITGILPIDIKAREKKELYWDKRRETKRAKEIRDKYLDLWQERWNNTVNGRMLYVIMPDVRERIKWKYEINHYLTQFLTGHGNFRGYLARFGIIEDENCKWCGVKDTPEHVIYDCWKFIEVRVELSVELREIGLRLDLREVVRNLEGMKILTKWIGVIGKIREAENIHLQ